MKKVLVRPLLWLALFSPALALADLCPEVGRYSNETRQVELDFVEMPVFTDLDGNPIPFQDQVRGLYSMVLSLPFGFADIKIDSYSLIGTITDSNPCYAKFDLATGSLEIPKILVPTLIPYLHGNPISGPVVECSATLQQSVIRPTVFRLTQYNCVFPQ
jgi:hypothetical protein